MPACLSRVSTRRAELKEERIRWRGGTSLRRSFFSASGRSVFSMFRTSSRVRRFMISPLCGSRGARRRYPPKAATRTAPETRSATTIMTGPPSFLPVRENAGREMDPGSLDRIEELGADSRRVELAGDLSFPVQAAFLEDEDV